MSQELKDKDGNPPIDTQSKSTFRETIIRNGWIQIKPSLNQHQKISNVNYSYKQWMFGNH